jgi:multidrug efflux pump subunit AcrA (membrane-fusion protein)
MKFISLCLVTLLLSAQPLYADAILTLDEAVETALKNHPQLVEARENLLAAKARTIQARATYYPQITEELEVDVAFTPPLKNFRLGEQSDVYITTESRKSTPALPSAALVTRDKKRGVWVVESGRLRFKSVTTGIEDPRNFTEITSGLDGSERIIAVPPAQMATFRDGLKVCLR